MEPRDLHVTQMSPSINAKLGQGLSSNHPGGVVVSFANRDTRHLSEELPPEVLRALLTIDGGEKVSYDDY